MALTAHQLLHLNAMLDEITEVRNGTSDYQIVWANGKEINPNKLIRFLDKAEVYLNLVITNDTWPTVTDEEGNVLTEPSAIHDYAEKRLTSLRK